MGLVALAVLLMAGLMAYVRLAPIDPARWHVAVPQGGQGGAYRFVQAAVPEEVLARLAAVADAHARTQVLAGSVAEGRITWVVRSRVWGFPDLVTAEVVPGGVAIWSRQRYGSRDYGVNTARLVEWVNAL